MANKFGGRIIVLDTANNDIAYTAANDAANGGVKYSTLPYKVLWIQVIDAANSNAVELTECEAGTITGNTLYKKTFLTGDLNPPAEPVNRVVNGLMPKTVGGSCKILVCVE